MAFSIFLTPIPVFAEIYMYSQTVKEWNDSVTRDRAQDKLSNKSH